MVSGDKDRKDAWGHCVTESTPPSWCIDHAGIRAWIVMHLMNATWGLQHHCDQWVHSSTAEVETVG